MLAERGRSEHNGSPTGRLTTVAAARAAAQDVSIQGGGATMRILTAEDDPSSRLVLVTTLAKWGYEVISREDGQAAWEVLQGPNPPQLAVLDWMMPGLDGIEVCRLVREKNELRHLYLIILTARDAPDDIAEGLNAGADDYIVKPFKRKELQARLQVGARVVRLQADLARRVYELEEANRRERHLRGLLPICSYCKKIRNDSNYWQQVEQYIAENSQAAFSHGICPDCYRTIVQPQLDALDQSRSAGARQDKPR